MSKDRESTLVSLYLHKMVISDRHLFGLYKAHIIDISFDIDKISFEGSVIFME